MEITIGMQNTARELSLETKQDAAEVAAAATKAMTEGSPLALTDAKGRQIVVAGSAIAYVEVRDEEESKVGFGRA